MAATKQQVIEFLNESFPQARCQVNEVGDKKSVISHSVGDDELRPGGTVAGPVIMKVADVALYVAILATVGIVPLAVTTNLNVSFLRKPAADAQIIAKCQLIKVGKMLVVGEVYLYSEGNDKPVAHAVGTYALPSDRD